MPREHERKSFLKEIVLESASGRTPARISDVSVGGCFIDTIADIPVGDEVSFELTDADGAAMRFAGRVRYHMAGIGLGVEFSDLSAEQAGFLVGTLG